MNRYGLLVALLVTMVQGFAPRSSRTRPSSLPSRFTHLASSSAFFDVDARDDKGETALILSAERGEAARVQALLELGADANACSHTLWTALHGAAEAGSVACVELLLAAGARIDAEANSGLTAEGIALKYGNDEAAALLRGGEKSPSSSPPPSSLLLGANAGASSSSTATRTASSHYTLVPVERIDGGDDDDGGRQTWASPLARDYSFASGDSYFVQDGEAVIKSVIVKASSSSSSPALPSSPCFERGGPRERVVFDPSAVVAAVVTCGGICPGLNTVVRELVCCLSNQYGVETVWGIPSGYRGFYESPDEGPMAWRRLTPAIVDQWHTLGGTVLGTSRGGHDAAKIVDALAAKGVNQVYVVGGDGTLRGASKVAAEIRRRGLRIAVAGVPKTVDNDIPIIDKSFGFETAVQEAQAAIQAATVEATCFPNGIGIVQLMGRNSGFIALHATLGSRDVDCVLIPEIDFAVDGPDGLMAFLEKRLLENGHVVVVIAEGSGQTLLRSANEEAREEDATEDVAMAGTVNKFEDVGVWLKGEVARHFKDHPDPRLQPVSLKYVDPTYMVRSVRANAADNVYCTALAHSAVHGAFSGRTDFMAGPVNDHHAYMPLTAVADRTNVVAVNDYVWARATAATGQPDFAPSADLDECEVSSDTVAGGCTVDFAKLP